MGFRIGFHSDRGLIMLQNLFLASPFSLPCNTSRFLCLLSSSFHPFLESWSAALRTCCSFFFLSKAERSGSSPFYGYLSGSAKAVERPCAREARHHDNPSLEPGCAVRKITFLKQPREMGLLMIKQLSSDYYALKLELPCIMLEDRIWGSRTGKLLIQIRTGIKILDSCLSHVFSDAFVLTWTIRDRACITINWTLGTTKWARKGTRTKADSPVTASSDVLEKEEIVLIWSQSY